MKKTNQLLFILFIIKSLFSFCQNNRIYGIVCDSLYSRRIVYFDLNSNTTHTAYNLYLEEGSLGITNFNGTSDPYNERYFFGGYSDSTPGYNIFIYNITTGVLSSILPSIPFDDIEYNPFRNEIIAKSNGSLNAIDLNTGIDSILVTDFSFSDYGFATVRTFDPINQRFALVSGNFGDPNYIIADVSNDTIISNIYMSIYEVPIWQVYDYITEKYYGLTTGGNVVSFDMFTGNQTQIVNLPGSVQMLNRQQATFDHDNGILYIPFYISGQAKLAIIDVLANSLISIVPFPKADLSKVFTKIRPALRLDGNEIISVYAENYQWYLNGGIIPGATNQKYTIDQSGYYKVLATFFNGKQEFSDSVYYLHLGNKETFADIFDVEVYPNPVSDLGTIYFSNLNGKKFDLKVFNTFGQIVFFQESILSNSIQINKGTLQSGLLYFQIISENKLIGKGKFLVE